MIMIFITQIFTLNTSMQSGVGREREEYKKGTDEVGRMGQGDEGRRGGVGEEDEPAVGGEGR